MNDFTEPVGIMYGDEDQITLLADRISQLHPRADLMGDDGCLYMAQISLATGAQALPEELGEIKVWKEGAELVFMLGFHYHNRMAQEKGGYVLVPEPEAMSKTTRNLYQLHEHDIGVQCGVLPLKRVAQFVEWGMDFRTVLDQGIGVATGVGTVSKKEIDEKLGQLVTGETWFTVASRRSIKAGLVRAFGGFAKPLTFSPNTMAPDPKSFAAVAKDYTAEEANGELF